MSSNKTESKVRKAATVRRPKFADEKYLGSEPTVTVDSTKVDMALAYNWFNYFYTSEDAKGFVLSYLKSIKYDKAILQKLAHVEAHKLHSAGWNCRLLAKGSTLPEGVWDNAEELFRSLASNVQAVENTGEQVAVAPKVISIQERIHRRASELISDLEEQLDVFFQEGVIQFDVKKWSLEKGIKPQIAKRIAEHFRPQYDEITEALKGKDTELVEAYHGWRKPVLKIMSLFIKRVIDHMDGLQVAGVAIRKPRKKKVKPASEQVSKVKYKAEDAEYGLKSIAPESIIGATTLIVFNTKYRKLSIYNAIDKSGFTVSGTSIKGFNETTSTTKVLRKPKEQLKTFMDGNKAHIKEAMKAIKCKEAAANGRINEETLILRVVK